MIIGGDVLTSGGDGLTSGGDVLTIMGKFWLGDVLTCYHSFMPKCCLM